MKFVELVDDSSNGSIQMALKLGIVFTVSRLNWVAQVIGHQVIECHTV